MDQRIIADFIGGSERAFAKIYAVYAPKVLRTARRVFRNEQIAEDFMQEFMTRMWERRDKFIEAKDFDAYLWGIAWNMVHDWQQKTLIRTQILGRYFKECEKPVHNDLEHHFAENDLHRLIEQALAPTPRRHEIFKLSREHGLSQLEIAQRLQLAKQTVDNEMTRALKAIRNFLK